MNLDDIEFRTLDYVADSEVRAYIRLFWDIPLEHNEYFTRRSDSFVDDWVISARKSESPSNTFPGIALHGAEIVGVHVARRFEEWEQVGVHIAGLWVHPSYRGLGIARVLKANGENWARSVGAMFMNTNVQAENHRMMSINEQSGFTLYRYNLRKRL